MSAIAALAILAIVVLTFDALLSHFAIKRLTCRRAFSRPTAFEGEQGEMIEIVRNDTPLPIPWLRIESRISPYIRLGKQENLLVGGEAYTCSVFVLLPFQQIRRRHQVRFLRRGAYELGSASLTVGDMLGLFSQSREQNMSAPMLVFPKLLEQGDLPPALERLAEEATVQPQLLTDPFLIRGIRPYRPGDPVRDMHWPATAKTGEAHVRLHDYTLKRRLMIVLGGENRANQWGDVLMDYETATVEHAISVAATLCVRALRAGQVVGFACNLQQAEAKEPTVLAPDAGMAREEELLCAFARLRHVRAFTLEELLRSLPARVDLHDTCVIVLTLYDSAPLQEALFTLRGRCDDIRLHVLRATQEVAS